MPELTFRCEKCGATTTVSIPRPPHPTEGGRCPKDGDGHHQWQRAK